MATCNYYESLLHERNTSRLDRVVGRRLTSAAYARHLAPYGYSRLILRFEQEGEDAVELEVYGEDHRELVVCAPKARGPLK